MFYYLATSSVVSRSDVTDFLLGKCLVDKNEAFYYIIHLD